MTDESRTSSPAPAPETIDSHIDSWISRLRAAIGETPSAPDLHQFRNAGLRLEELGELERWALQQPAGTVDETATIVCWAIGVGLVCGEHETAFAALTEGPLDLAQRVIAAGDLLTQSRAWIAEITRNGTTLGQALNPTIERLRAAITRLESEHERLQWIVDRRLVARVDQLRYEVSRLGAVQGVTHDEMECAHRAMLGQPSADHSISQWCTLLVAARLVANTERSTVQSWMSHINPIVSSLLERNRDRVPPQTLEPLRASHERLLERLDRPTTLPPEKKHSLMTIPPVQRRTAAVTQALPVPRTRRLWIGGAIGLLGLALVASRLTTSESRAVSFEKNALGVWARSFRDVRLTRQPDGVVFVGRLAARAEDLPESELSILLRGVWDALTPHNVKRVLLVDKNDVPVARQGPPGGRKILAFKKTGG